MTSSTPLRDHLDRLAANGPFLVLDVHSYNHRRHGRDAPPAGAGNPEVNVGTGALDGERGGSGRVRRGSATSRCADTISTFVSTCASEVAICAAGSSTTTPHGVPLAIEFKKVFMDEWTGECDDAHVSELREHLGVAAGLRSTRWRMRR